MTNADPAWPSSFSDLALQNLREYAFFAIDLDGVLASWHPGVAEVFGFEREAFVGRPFRILFPEEDAAAGAAERELANAAERGRAADDRWQRRADGSRFYGRGVTIALRGEGDEPLGYAKIVRDVTEQRRAEAARRESEERYRTLFDSTDEGFCVIEVMFDEAGVPRDYRFLELNARFAEQTGLEDAQGRTARELVPNLERHWFDIYGAVALSGEPTRFENGSEEMGRWFDVYAFRIGGEGSRTVGILFKDITDRRRAELALAELNRDLEARVRARTRQVRELAAQLTLAEAAERARLARVLHSDLQQQLYAVQFTLRDAHRGGAEETRDALDEAGRLLADAIAIARSVTTDLSPPVLRGDGLVEALRWLGDAMEARYGLAVSVEAAAGLTVPAESVRVLLFEAVRELLFNVVKHAATDAATVALSERGEQLVVSVHDAGRGFDPARQSEERRGTGLGLSGVRNRLRLFGGDLEIAAAAGEGVRATVRLPVASLKV